MVELSWIPSFKLVVELAVIMFLLHNLIDNSEALLHKVVLDHALDLPRDVQKKGKSLKPRAPLTKFNHSGISSSHPPTRLTYNFLLLRIFFVSNKSKGARRTRGSRAGLRHWDASQPDDLPNRLTTICKKMRTLRSSHPSACASRGVCSCSVTPARGTPLSLSLCFSSSSSSPVSPSPRQLLLTLG